MAQRKRELKGAVRFELTDEEIESLRLVCKVADEMVGMNGIARRWEAFLINAKAMGRGQVVEQTILNEKVI